MRIYEWADGQMGKWANGRMDEWAKKNTYI